ncbi:MAG TPA: flagellin [Geminicoccaceae bacterium]|nr:flagellin [Geminicoccus sp.]HMU50229.1 flagellin [Geminicoccaceae bacterium]
MVGRVGDAAQSYRTGTTLLQIQGRLRDLQTSIATGKAAGSYADMPSSTAVLLRSQSHRTQLGTFISQNEHLLDRLQAVDGALGAIGAIAERMRSLVVNRLDAATGASVPLDTEVDSALEEIEARLNLQIEGRYVFAGSRTDTAPVDLPSPPITSTDSSLYYQGDAVPTRSRVGPDVELDHSLTAAEGPFAQLISALGQAREAHLAGDNTGLESALTDLAAAIGGIADLRGDNGAKATRLESITETHRSTALYLDDTIDRLESTDLPAAMARLAEEQANLEAAYMTVSSLTKLSLVDFLR